MPIITKAGVVWDGVRGHTLEAIAVAERIYNEYGLDCVITTLNDSKHMTGSLHYKGLAVDLRLPIHPYYDLDIAVSAGMTIKFAEELKKALFPDYTVIHEPDHYHIEYDPKSGRLAEVS